MSVSGRKNRTFRKLEVKESKKGAKGFTDIQFAHKATAGATFIDVNSLNTPTTEMPSFTNPTASRIIEARMHQFAQNVSILSSADNTMIRGLNYEISSNSVISFINGFTASADEIFFVEIGASPISGLQVVDARTPTAEGDLGVGLTDFAIGFATSTLRNQIVVYRNGIEQKRNTDNSDSVLDGNYRVVPGTDPSYGNVIRFNDAVVVDPDYIRVVGIGNTVESPTNSTWDELEKQQGQIDALVPTVAALAGVPETDFQDAPNNVDLKQFGDRVLDLETNKIKIQTKTFTGPSNVDGTIFQFNNLVIGSIYRIDLSSTLSSNDASALTVRAVNNGSTKASINYDPPVSGAASINCSDYSYFEAAATTMIIEAVNFVGSPDRSYSGVKATITHDPSVKLTTDFT